MHTISVTRRVTHAVKPLQNASEEMVTTALYAGDTKIFNCIGSEEDCLALQGTLSNMEHWSKVNNIYFNASKCKALSVTRKRKPLCYSYNLDGVHLTRAAEVKDLGVTITSSLSWDTHIHDIVAKANNLPRLLKKTCPLLTDVNVRRTLYLSLVKSHQLSYPTQVWSPKQYSLKAKIERVQRRATRWILQTRVDEMSYKERLVILNLLPFVLDRQLKDLFYYKCFFGSTDINVLEHTSFISHGRTRRSNPFNLKSHLCRTITFKASYFNRITKLRNFVCSLKSPSSFSGTQSFKQFVYSYFEKGCGKNVHATIPKGNKDMINVLFLTLQLSNLIKLSYITVQILKCKIPETGLLTGAICKRLSRRR